MKPWCLLFFIDIAGIGQAAASNPEQFGLAELLQRTIKNDGRVLAAQAGLEVYRAQYQEARWLWFPVIKLEGLFGGPVGARRLDLEACPDKATCIKLKSDWRAGNFDYGEVSFAVGGKIEAALPLYTFGKLDGVKQAAQAGIEAGESEIQKARQQVALEVRKAYYGWLLASETVEILKDGVSKLKEAKKRLDEMLEADSPDVTDKDRAKLGYYAAEVDAMLSSAQEGQQIALAALRFLSGINDLKHTQIQRIELKAPDPFAIDRNQAKEQAIRQRPEIAQLESAKKALEAMVSIQKANFYPDFFLAGYFQASYSPVHDYIENSLLNNGLTNYDGGLGLGFRVTLDIPQKLARLEKAKSELAKLENQIQLARQALGLELDKHMERLKKSLNTIQHRKKGFFSARSWMRSNFMSEAVGLTDTKDLLDSLGAYAKAQLEHNLAIYESLVATDELKQAMGENLSESTPEASLGR